MGYSSWSDDAWRGITERRTSTPNAEIFRGESSVDPLMDPRRFTVRESRDSEHHPRSVPIIVGFDVTASMGFIPERFAKEMLGQLMHLLVENAWVTDPQVLFAAIGDAVSDRGPLQVGQFESGLEMDAWLTRIWLEGRGGDPPESYTLAHWFAAQRTSTDAWERRREKGFLFTIGDAENKALKPPHIQRVFGGEAPTGDVSDAAVIAAAAERWEVFHILVTRGQPPGEALLAHWRERVGHRLLVLDNVDAICTLIGIAMARTRGRVDHLAAVQQLEAAGMSTEAARKAVDGMR